MLQVKGYRTCEWYKYFLVFTLRTNLAKAFLRFNILVLRHLQLIQRVGEEIHLLLINKIKYIDWFYKNNRTIHFRKRTEQLFWSNPVMWTQWVELMKIYLLGWLLPPTTCPWFYHKTEYYPQQILVKECRSGRTKPPCQTISKTRRLPMSLFVITGQF